MSLKCVSQGLMLNWLIDITSVEWVTKVHGSFSIVHRFKTLLFTEILNLVNSNLWSNKTIHFIELPICVTLKGNAKMSQIFGLLRILSDISFRA